MSFLERLEQVGSPALSTDTSLSQVVSDAYGKNVAPIVANIEKHPVETAAKAVATGAVVYFGARTLLGLAERGAENEAAASGDLFGGRYVSAAENWTRHGVDFSAMYSSPGPTYELKGAHITDQVIDTLVKTPPWSDNIHLNLAGSKITDLGVERLAGLGNSLQFLSVRNTAVTDAGISWLKKEVPDIVLER